MQAVERAVERVVEAIHENYGEELSIDDMARTAMYSKFHFTRIFQRVTGLTPGRFLSAVRLQKAKQLLTSTSLTVTDISHLVGYTSIGTFSSRFGYSVGVPPSTYRRLGGFRPWVSFQNRRNAEGHRVIRGGRSTILGNITVPHFAGAGPIFIGLFPTKIPQGEPVRCAILRQSGSYVLEDVPQGTWHVMACSPRGNGLAVHGNGIGHSKGNGIGNAGGSGHGIGNASGHGIGNGIGHSNGNGHPNGNGRLVHDEGMSVGYYGPITMFPGMRQMADIRLRPMRALDPPVLLALPDLRPESLRDTRDSAA